ncbi:hypothetical protein [Methanimicrococcus blatticola]|uniref:Uncharacterized protein n=1 Tax=Methanimicrococcus blatticola TaxID=91560 RepID=A0A484F6R6_9EURY|nr:hypothetical protein [Methanimicrococcus blatticola]MBZ3935012.1 hypothetical protein [Methanimicrococcus blatticola]MCC2508890.1 hypothetical protein [Methanimicrococcus blatticola]TDQ71082.1 hypothetical protein C7391_0181 [Methanimicrococcus blatticola]
MTESPEKNEKLVFIFDVESQLESKISLFFKRSITPSKIECPLYRLTHSAKGLKPEVAEYMTNFGLEYETLYRDEFIKKYEGFEIFGTFKIADATYPSVYIVIGSEREERQVYELIAARYFSKCESLSCFSRVLKRKYSQFKELGPAEFKKINSPGYKPENDSDELDEKEEKKQKIETAHQKIVDMENEMKKKQAE